MKRSVLIGIGIGIALGVLFALAAIGASMPNNLPVQSPTIANNEQTSKYAGLTDSCHNYFLQTTAYEWVSITLKGS